MTDKKPDTLAEFVEAMTGKPLNYTQRMIADSIEYISTVPHEQEQAPDTSVTRIHGVKVDRMIVDDPGEYVSDDPFDPSARAAEKTASRAADAAALASGEKTIDDLNYENGAFGFPPDTVRITMPQEPQRIVPRALTDVQRRGGKGTP